MECFRQVGFFFEQLPPFPLLLPQSLVLTPKSTGSHIAHNIAKYSWSVMHVIHHFCHLALLTSLYPVFPIRWCLQVCTACVSDIWQERRRDHWLQGVHLCTVHNLQGQLRAETQLGLQYVWLGWGWEDHTHGDAGNHWGLFVRKGTGHKLWYTWGGITFIV